MKKIQTKKPKKENKNTKEVKEKKVIWKSILNICLVVAIVIISIALAFLLYIVVTSPDFDKEQLFQKEPTILYDVNGNEFARVGAFNSTLLTYDEIPDVMIDAVVATEDSRFFQHNGIDLVRFLKASFFQLLGKKDAGGASTLSMQVIKNTYNGGPEAESHGMKGIVRKFKDIYMAVFKLEANYTKEEIIEFYLNSEWFANAGNINIKSGIYGIEEASLYYFGKSAKDLSLPEASLLVGMFQNPAWYNPYTNEEGCRIRQNTVLKLMVRHGYITEEQKDAVLEIPVSSLLVEQSKQKLKVENYQAFVDYVINEVKEDLNVDPMKVALKIYTTYDPEVQKVLEKVEKGEVYKFPSDVIQEGIAITSSSNGSIVALSGGRNYTAKGTNFSLTRRQPGSTAKPFMDYAMFIEHISQSSYATVNDEKTNYRNSNKAPANYDGGWKGIISIRYALSDSRNVPALKIFRQVYDLDKTIIENFAHSIGIDYGKELYEPVSIGGGDITASPLEISAVYGTFARGGYYIEPYAYTKVINTVTEKEKTHSYTQKKVMEESTAYMLTSILDDVYGTKRNTTTGRSDGIAGKTGTTNLDKQTKEKHGLSSGAISDSWYVTYSSKYSIAFWYGYESLDKAEADHKETGFNFNSTTGGAARKNIMKELAKLHKGCKQFEQPKNVVTANVEVQSFPPQLCSANTPSSLCVTEYFLEGTEPTEVSKRFSQLDNPTNGNYSYNGGNTITLSWNAIKTPDLINPTYLSSLFEQYCGEDANAYYNKRIEYNNKNIGTLNYVIYLRDASGNETRIGSTNSNTFTYMVPTGGDYTFVVKSAYTIFNKNASSGLVINARTIDNNIGNMVEDNTNNDTENNNSTENNDTNNNTTNDNQNDLENDLN